MRPHPAIKNFALVKVKCWEFSALSTEVSAVLLVEMCLLNLVAATILNAAFERQVADVEMVAREQKERSWESVVLSYLSGPSGLLFDSGVWEGTKWSKTTLWRKRLQIFINSLKSDFPPILKLQTYFFNPESQQLFIPQEKNDKLIEDIKTLFGEMDKGGTGRLSYEEYMEADGEKVEWWV